MTHRIALLLLPLAACTADPSEPPAANMIEPATAPDPGPAPPPAAPAPAPAARATLTTAGLDALRIGAPVPPGTGWAERGAQISDACRTVSSPDFPGVYAIVENGRVRRITLGQRSDLRTGDGLAVGAGEAAVRAALPGLREEPHEYVEAPGKYLTDPAADAGAPAFRFEIGADSRVTLIHAGTMPVLGYVEGCA